VDNILKFRRRKPSGPRQTPPFLGALIVIALASAIAWCTSPPLAIGTGGHGVASTETAATVRTGRNDDVSRVQSSDAHSVRFAMCGSSARENCVVDGDTFHFRGEKIRVADIDAPETNPPRCQHEADLGDQATETLLALLNAGPFTLANNPDGRDVDRYGRKLRIVMRDGASIGAILVARGLARTWTGRRQPWCT
jgi:micrococcal nuclease